MLYPGSRSLLLPAEPSMTTPSSLNDRLSEMAYEYIVTDS